MLKIIMYIVHLILKMIKRIKIKIGLKILRVLKNF